MLEVSSQTWQGTAGTDGGFVDALDPKHRRCCRPCRRRHPPRARHYRIFKESSGRYTVFGETRNHDFGSLSEVIEYHSQVPVSVAAGDTCDIPLPRDANGRNVHVGLEQELDLTPDGIDPVARDGPGAQCCIVCVSVSVCTQCHLTVSFSPHAGCIYIAVCLCFRVYVCVCMDRVSIVSAWSVYPCV